MFHCDGLTNGAGRYGAHSSAFLLNAQGVLGELPTLATRIPIFPGGSDEVQKRLHNLYVSDKTPPALTVYTPSSLYPAP